MAVDANKHESVGRQIGESMRQLVSGLVRDLDEALTEHDERVRAAHETHKRAEEERGRTRLADLQEALTAQAASIREDMVRIAKERQDAIELRIRAIEGSVRAAVDEAASKARQETTEHIAAAVRSVHDDIGVRLAAAEARIKEIRDGS